MCLDQPRCAEISRDVPRRASSSSLLECSARPRGRPSGLAPALNRPGACSETGPEPLPRGRVPQPVLADPYLTRSPHISPHLRCLNLYSQQILERSELFTLVLDLFKRSEIGLFTAFRRLLGYQGGDPVDAPSPPQSKAPIGRVDGPARGREGQPRSPEIAARLGADCRGRLLPRLGLFDDEEARHLVPHPPRLVRDAFLLGRRLAEIGRD